MSLASFFPEKQTQEVSPELNSQTLLLLCKKNPNKPKNNTQQKPFPWIIALVPKHKSEAGFLKLELEQKKIMFSSGTEMFHGLYSLACDSWTNFRMAWCSSL